MENKKQIGIVGLGKMGGNLVKNLCSKHWNVFGYTKKDDKTNLIQVGMQISKTAEDFAANLETPRIIWLMVPHHAVDDTINELLPHLENGDSIIDGGNSFYENSIARQKILKEKGINFLDVGVSGGPDGALNNPCLMVGGEKEVYQKLEFIFDDLNPNSGVKYVGGPGAGHFAKMIHNGIEYGMMQAIGEGFEILKKSEYNFDLEKISEIYSKDSVISSRLIDWLNHAYKKHRSDLNSETCCSSTIGHSGEGEWTIKEAKKMKIKIPVIKEAFNFRKKSARKKTYTGKVVSALRYEFGGHESKPSKDDII